MIGSTPPPPPKKTKKLTPTVQGKKVTTYCNVSLKLGKERRYAKREKMFSQHPVLQFISMLLIILEPSSLARNVLLS